MRQRHAKSSKSLGGPQNDSLVARRKREEAAKAAEAAETAVQAEKEAAEEARLAWTDTLDLKQVVDAVESGMEGLLSRLKAQAAELDAEDSSGNGDVVVT